MKWLVYHYGGLGDFIALLPALSYVKTHHHSPISLLGKPSFGALAQKNGLIDTILDAAGKENLFLFLENPPSEKLDAFFSEYTHIILFVNSGSQLLNNAKQHSRAKIFQIEIVPPSAQAVSDYYLKCITSDTIPCYQRSPDLTKMISITENIKNHYMPFKRNPVVALHPGSGSPKKNWPLQNYVELAELLRNRGCRILWFSGEADKPHTLPASDLHFCSLALPVCAGILSQCTVYCGNDSGFSHLATASGCATVVLFGPSNEIVWAPRGSNGITVITNRSCRSINTQSHVSTTGYSGACRMPQIAVTTQPCLNQHTETPQQQDNVMAQHLPDQNNALKCNGCIDKIAIEDVYRSIIGYIPHLNHP